MSASKRDDAKSRMSGLLVGFGTDVRTKHSPSKYLLIFFYLSGVPIVTLMTKVDLICPCVKSGKADLVYKSTNVLNAVKKLSEEIGLDALQIFPILNCSESPETRTNEKTSMLAAITLNAILNKGNEHIEKLQDFRDMNAEADDDGSDGTAHLSNHPNNPEDAARGPAKVGYENNNLNVP